MRRPAIDGDQFGARAEPLTAAATDREPTMQRAKMWAIVLAVAAAGRNTAAAPGFLRRCGGRATSRQRRTESENIASRGCDERARVRPRDLFPVRNPGFRRWPPVSIWAAPPGELDCPGE